MAFDDFIQELSDEAADLKYSKLLELSGLSSDDTREFKVAWSSVSQSRKQDILGRLLELCEDNLELDFSSVFKACLDDVDVDVKEKAMRGLWESEDRSIIGPLIDLLEDDPAPRIRATAATTLGRFAEMAQDGKLLSSDGNRIQVALMGVIDREEEELEVRRRAIEAVAYFEFPERDDIILVAYQSGDDKLKQSSIYAMGRSSNSEWLSRVIGEMEHDSAAIRFEAATALGHLGDESVVAHLITLVQDEDQQVQLAATEALGAVGGKLAKRALQRCLQMGDESMENVARDALKNIEFDEDPLGYRFEP